MSWIYKQPVEIIFGIGELTSLPKRLSSAKKPLIVTNSFFLGNENVKAVISELNAEVFTDVSENPDVSEVNRCSRLIKEIEIDDKLYKIIINGSKLDPKILNTNDDYVILKHESLKIAIYKFEKDENIYRMDLLIKNENIIPN